MYCVLESNVLSLERWTHNVDHSGQEVDEDGDEDDAVSSSVGLVDPTAGFSQEQGQTFVVLCRCDQNQTGVKHNQDRELDHHSHDATAKQYMLMLNQTHTFI